MTLDEIVVWALRRVADSHSALQCLMTPGKRLTRRQALIWLRRNAIELEKLEYMLRELKAELDE
jgi:hypothetical protein